MSDEIKQNPEGKSHKELRKEYTFNKLKGLGQEIIKGLIDQLDGITEIKNNNGFELMLYFK